MSVEDPEQLMCNLPRTRVCCLLMLTFRSTNTGTIMPEQLRSKIVEPPACNLILHQQADPRQLFAVRDMQYTLLTTCQW